MSENQFIPFLACEASAGSGKTFTLTIRYLTLLFKEVHPDKILALTFTNKAAGEMVERISSTLENLETKEAELNELSKYTSISKEEILKSKHIYLNRFLNSSYKILTIDKFFNQILRSFSLYAGLMPNYEINDLDEEQVFNEFLDELMLHGGFDELVHLSLIEDLKATKLMDLFKILKSNEVKTERGEPIDFALKSALEKDIFETAQSMSEMIHGCSNRSKTMENAFVFESLDELVKKSWLERESLNYRTFSKCYSEELDGYLQDLKDELKKYYRLKEGFILDKIFALFATYEKISDRINKRSGFLSFSDVTKFTKKILSSVDKDFIYFRLDARLEHILIDEFQDTSAGQIEILTPLIEEIVSGIGVKDELKSFFLVGDKKQSIYRFRGGDSKLFDFTVQKFDLKTSTLDTNFRSSKAVVEFVNKTFKNVYPNYVEQKTKKDANEGYVEILECEAIDESLVETVQDLLLRNIHPSDIAILVYKNEDSINYSSMLKSHFPDLPIITDTSGKLINRPVPRAIIEMMKYIYYDEKIYLANFNANVGLDPYTPAQEFIDRGLLHKTPLEIGKLVVENYELNWGDNNIVKFFTTLSKFKDIFSFLDSIENDSTSIDKGEIDGITILTIHKSKGLEYKHVIVSDRLTKKPADRSSLIFSYDGVELNKISYRYSGRDKFDKEYKEILEEQKELALEDHLNSLYVAFTRAREELYILRDKEKSSFEDLTFPYLKTGKKLLLQEREENQVSNKTEIVTMPQFGRQDSFLHHENSVETGDFENIYKGDAIHFCLEIIHGFKDEYLEEALQATRNAFGMYVDMDEVEAIVKKLISDPYFQELTSQEVFKEQSIMVDNEHKVIDLLCKTAETYYICDYKTGRHHSKYEKQIKEYIEGVQTLFSKADVKGYLIYLSKENVEFKGVS